MPDVKINHRTAAYEADMLLTELPRSVFCGCITQFVSNLVENPEDRFFNDTAHIIYKSAMALLLYSDLWQLIRQKHVLMCV